MYSIVIPTYNRQADLCKCLDCLAHYFKADVQEKLGFSVEVIVSDDAKQTSLKDHLAKCYPWVRYVEGPSRGPAANRNNGANHAKGEWLVFTDDDCLPEYGWISAFDALSRNGSVLEGKTSADRPKQRMDEESPINETGGYLWSCNFAIKKSLYCRLNGFDENFPSPAMEDVDLKKRIIDSGEIMVFVPEATVIHPWRIVRGVEFDRKHQMSLFYFWEKHPEEKPSSLFKYFAYRAVRSLLIVTIPGIFKYNGKGIWLALSRDLELFRQTVKYIGS